MFQIQDQSGNIIHCELLFMFQKENKNYIVYIDEDENILSSFYKQENNTITIFPITLEEDFRIVEEELKRRDL